jgi:hypothetical protein
MSRYANSALRGARPWGRNDSGGIEEEPREAAPRQGVTYHCERACAFSPFIVPLAAEATPPPAWDCRCGGTGRLDGAPEDTPAEVILPGYTTAQGQHKRAIQEGMGPWGQLRKRRSIPELDALLAERLEAVRGQQ